VIWWGSPNPIYPGGFGSPLVKLGANGDVRLGKLHALVNGREWPGSQGIEAIAASAAEMKRKSAEGEAESDAKFKEFTDFAAKNGVPIEYVAYAKAGYAAWKAAGGLLNSLFGSDGDSEENQKRAENAFTTALGSGYPVPWKVFQLAVSATASTIADLIEHYTKSAQALPANQQEGVRHWWLRFMANIKNPMVARAYASPYLSAWGEITDGLVMLVALPYAIDAGVDPLPLAVRLWHEVAPGANQVQSLALLAIRARELTTGGTILYKPPESQTSVVAPVVIGGSSALAGFFIAGPLGAVIGGGLGWLLGRRL